MTKINGEPKRKFMLSLDPNMIERLKPWMNGFNLQQLIRAKIIPEWEQHKLGTLAQNAYGRGYQAHKRKIERQINGSSPKVLGNRHLPKST